MNKYSFGLVNYHRELNEGELKDKEIRIRQKIDDAFIKAVIIPAANNNTFEKDEMMKKRPYAKNIWYY